MNENRRRIYIVERGHICSRAHVMIRLDVGHACLRHDWGKWRYWGKWRVMTRGVKTVKDKGVRQGGLEVLWGPNLCEGVVTCGIVSLSLVAYLTHCTEASTLDKETETRIRQTWLHVSSWYQNWKQITKVLDVASNASEYQIPGGVPHLVFGH